MYCAAPSTTASMAFISVPYTGSDAEIEHRVELMTIFDAFLMKSGIYTVSPIYKHLMLLKNVEMPGDWLYWKDYSIALLDRCDILYVLCLPGWKSSTGVSAEIKFAVDTGKTINYVTPQLDATFLISHVPPTAHYEGVSK